MPPEKNGFSFGWSRSGFAMGPGSKDPLYEAMCVCLRERHRQVVFDGGLFWDRRKDRVGGRSLSIQVPAFGGNPALLPGDRLVPSKVLPDVGELSALALPATVTFWRPKYYKQACTDNMLYRNPLFSRRTLAWPALTFVLDVLHVLYLGVHQRIISAVIWAIIDNNVFNIRGGRDVIIDGTLERLSEHLEHWYSENKIPLNYQIGGWQKSMIGSPEYPDLKTMGSETNALLPWALAVCVEFSSRIDHGFALTEACRSLCNFMCDLKQAPAMPSHETIRKLMDNCLRHVHFVKEIGIPFMFKHHFWVHMVRRIPRYGNPFKFACFLDESLNLHAAVAAANVHRAHWEQRLFERIDLLGDLARGQHRFFYGSGASGASV